MSPAENGPRVFTRRRVLRDLAAGAVGLAAGSIFSEPIANTLSALGKSGNKAVASPTAAPTADVPTPTAKKTPDKTAEPSKTPEITAPHIDGLRFDTTTKKYYAEPGNSYGLEVNTYAGEQIIYTLGSERASGVVLVGNVVRVLSAKANTPEGVAQDRWQIPLPLDPRNAEKPVKITEGKISGVNYLGVSNLSSSVSFVSPFENSTLIKANSFDGSQATELDYFPTNLIPNSALVFNHYGELKAKDKQKIGLAQTLFDNAQQELKPPFAGNQVTISVSGKTTPGSISLSNVLSIDSQKIFLAQSK